MKKIFKSAAVILSALSLASCQDILDIPSETAWGAGNFPTTESHIKGLLYGGYDNLQSALGTDFIRYGEARSDNFDLAKENNDTWKQILNNTLDTGISGSSWSSFYNVIKQANLVIDNIDKVRETSGVKNYNSYLGQAKVMRAFAYFWIVRIWGDAPLVKKAYAKSGDIENLGRAPQAEILAFLKDDLLSARSLLNSKSYERTTFSHAAANAILAQVYAWEHDWVNTVNYANSVIGSAGYKLVSLYDSEIDPNLASFVEEVLPNLEYSRMFNSSGLDETIFEMAYNYADNETNDGLFNLLSYTNHPLKPFDTLYEAFEMGDWRYQVCFYKADGTRSTKMLMNYTRQSMAHSIVLLRLAETMLLKAEALANINDTETDSEAKAKNTKEILDILNAIRVRAGGDSFKYDEEEFKTLPQDTVKDLIAKERRVELFCEGHRYFDLYRTGKLAEVMGPINGQTNLDSFWWPVNLSEIRRANGRITQNEYYK